MRYVKSTEELEKMRIAGHINALTHLEIANVLTSGIATEELDSLAAEFMQKQGANSSFKGLNGYPKHICISVNQEIGHGIPGKRIIQSGDVVKVDIGTEYQGFHADSAVTMIIGNTDANTRKLVQTTQSALFEGIRAATVGRRLSDVSYAIFKLISSQGFAVVRRAFGHGIGTELHEEPLIPNFGPPHLGPLLKHGMTLAIEPVATTGSRYSQKAQDGWTDVTVDGSMSAHFEHTVLVSSHGTEILTALSQDNQPGLALHRNMQNFCLDNIHFRGMNDSDREALLDMACSEMDPILMEAWGRRVNPQEIFDEVDAEIEVLENSEGTIVGFFAYSRKEKAIHLNTLVIGSTFQGQGLGTEVMHYLEQVAVNNQVNEITLCVQTNNRRAIDFYHKLGFTVSDCPYANTLQMSKKTVRCLGG